MSNSFLATANTENRKRNTNLFLLVLAVGCALFDALLVGGEMADATFVSVHEDTRVAHFTHRVASEVQVEWSEQMSTHLNTYTTLITNHT